MPTGEAFQDRVAEDGALFPVSAGQAGGGGYEESSGLDLLIRWRTHSLLSLED